MLLQHKTVTGGVFEDAARHINTHLSVAQSPKTATRGLCLVDADPTTYSHPENWSYFEPEAML